MISGIDFSMPYPVQVTLIVSVCFPFILMFMARIPILMGCNAHQFLYAFILTAVIWFIMIVMNGGVLLQMGHEPFWVGICLFGAIMQGYLEIWGLLSRGYSLGILLTFYKANKPLGITQLAQSYRGGEGLDWLIRHRLSGLKSSKLVTINDNQVSLTRKGIFVTWVYQYSIRIFGLRYTG